MRNGNKFYDWRNVKFLKNIFEWHKNEACACATAQEGRAVFAIIFMLLTFLVFGINI